VDQALAFAKEKPSPQSPKTEPEAQDSSLTTAVTRPGASASESTRATVPGFDQERLPSANAPSPGSSDDYQIGAGDVLQVSVWKSPEISVPSVIVRPDGMITIPLIKDVHVGHLTPTQAERLITEGLAKYIIDPNVTVVVGTSNSKKVYIVGSVRAEGPVAYTYRMTVMQAISEAGGLTEYAKRKKIYVLRNEIGRDYRLDFNYDEVVRGFRIEQNIELLPGDTVVIPQ
jgi:polysaccharide export outer membrane protein